MVIFWGLVAGVYGICSVEKCLQVRGHHFDFILFLFFVKPIVTTVGHYTGLHYFKTRNIMSDCVDEFLCDVFTSPFCDEYPVR